MLAQLPSKLVPGFGSSRVLLTFNAFGTADVGGINDINIDCERCITGERAWGG